MQLASDPIKTVRGVYFIANDAIIDNAIAFLNSFREHNPQTALCLVPYDDSIVRLCELKNKYNFSIWRSENLFQYCAHMSVQFHGRVFGHYRKLALWEGPFDEFIYIDTDTVVLHDVKFVFEYLKDYAFITSHSNLGSIRKWVWKSSIDQVKELTAEQVAFSTNTGFISSRRGSLSVSEALRVLPRALSLAPHMRLLCIEQPFLNYLFVTSGHPYTSLLTLFLQSRSSEIALERWGGRPLGRFECGRLIDPPAHPILLVHWAGEWKRAAIEGTTVHNFRLWKHYRYLNEEHQDQHSDLQMMPIT